MERFRIPIGRPLGIRLWVHASWFAVLAFISWAAAGAFGDAYPELPLAERAAMGVVTAVAFFACLVIHELSHAVVARRFGLEVRGITLFLFGGVAEIRGEVPTPSKEFAVALVGPATSLTLGGVLGLAAVWATDRRLSGAEGVLFTLAVVNVGVALFNLVPGLPLDGGRLLRAGLWRISGDFSKATRVAVAAGRVLAVALLVLGGVLVATGNGFGAWYGAMAVFLWLLAGRSGRASPPGEALAWHGEGQAAQSGS
ncbi:MAG TPA: site-2 protease family protein [Actinomycetota bacterium]|nr:site-2 protease family protein [Actinomycetota bacterium]